MKPGDEVLFTREDAQGRGKQSVAIKSSSAAHYSFAFTYTLEAIASNAELVNEARIYSISVTNLRKIGARTYRPCNASTSLDGYHAIALIHCFLFSCPLHLFPFPPFYS